MRLSGAHDVKVCARDFPSALLCARWWNCARRAPSAPLISNTVNVVSIIAVIVTEVRNIFF